MLIDVTRLIDLRSYGYAPGGYCHPCWTCLTEPMSRPSGDKRSIRCFVCAAQLALDNPRTQGDLFAEGHQ